ncbi:hypothetical protein SRM_00537 [Salinibacter ruber M8]|uniref:Uncharacterized protein n=1 Tax=Salinibacter ruber (strain M8) TaxID=761659 RepID=D5H603_SALRM|nr:hypothetical protein SRM_00537 [Salinibacter ruber M8]
MVPLRSKYSIGVWGDSFVSEALPRSGRNTAGTDCVDMADIGERWRWRRRGQTRVAPSFHPAVQRQYDEETEEREASLYDGADGRL